MKETKLQDKSTRVKRKRLERAGPLFIDEKHLKEGFKYRIVNDERGEIQRRERMGYHIVQDSDLAIGDKNVTTSSRLGSAVTVDVGRSHELKGVLMAIPDEDHAEILEELKEAADRQEEQLFNDLSPKHFYGGIRKE